MAAAAIFVKTPGFSPLKTRLAAGVGREAALRFHVLSSQATRAVVEAAARRSGATVYWAIAEAAALGQPLWGELPRVFQGEGPLGDRLGRVYTKLVERHGSVALLGADAPLLGVGQVARALALLDRASREGRRRWVLLPAFDGGFALFGANFAIAPGVWGAVPYGTQNAAQALVEALRGVGADFWVGEPVRDVDTAEDLALLLAESEASSGGSVLTGEDWLGEQREVLAWARRILRPGALGLSEPS